MMAYKKTKWRFFAVVMLVCFLSCSQFSISQNIKIIVDKRQILIGEQIRYEIDVNLPSAAYSVTFPLPDSILHFDILQKNKPDKINENGNYSFHQTLLVTSFDSGSWRIPSLPVIVTSNNNSTNLFTDSILIDVGYSPADSTGQLRDIKPVIEVSVTDYFWYYILGAVIVILITGILLYWYFEKKKWKVQPLFKSSLSPYDEAMSELQLLKNYNLEIPEEVKQFHTKLSEIFKRYYSRKQQKNLMNKTTGEILPVLKENDVDTTLISSLAESLRCADAVKFAKYIPVSSESERYADLITQSIMSLEKKQQT